MTELNVYPRRFRVYLAASDGTTHTHDGVQWLDGTCVAYPLHHSAMTLTVWPNLDILKTMTHGKLTQIEWCHRDNYPIEPVNDPLPEVPGYTILGELKPSPPSEASPEQKRAWMNAGLCMNCGRKGAHYVPPSGGGSMPGFYACDSINEREASR